MALDAKHQSELLISEPIIKGPITVSVVIKQRRLVSPLKGGVCAVAEKSPIAVVVHKEGHSQIFGLSGQAKNIEDMEHFHPGFVEALSKVFRL